MSQLFSETFAVKLKSCAKSRQILRFLPSQIFGVQAPWKFGHYWSCPPYGMSYGKVSWFYSLYSWSYRCRYAKFFDRYWTLFEKIVGKTSVPGEGVLQDLVILLRM